MADQETGSLRERKKERTRRAIVTSAMELFAGRGFDQVTMAEVAAGADVAPRTLFRYVADKQDLVFGEEVMLGTRLAEALAAQPADEAPAVSVREALVQMAGTWQDMHDLGRVRQRVVDGSPELRAASRAKQAAHEDVLRAGLTARGTDAQDARLLARVAVACAEEGVQAWLVQDDPRDPDVQERVRRAFADLAALATSLV